MSKQLEDLKARAGESEKKSQLVGTVSNSIVNRFEEILEAVGCSRSKLMEIAIGDFINKYKDVNLKVHGDE